jgi:hypothetical protein
MPIVFVQGAPQTVLRCINHDSLPATHEKATDQWTTMRAEEDWAVIQAIVPPRTAPGAMIGAAVIHGRGQVLRCYTCAACGYVEMYDAATIDPATWLPAAAPKVG